MNGERMRFAQFSPTFFLVLFDVIVVLVVRFYLSCKMTIVFVSPDEFKPASIDKNQPGKLHKTKDNKISVEFQNNQPGKPKVVFDGSSEDYKENDAVLFFDGESFRLERLHRAVKRLRYNRLPGESAAAVAPGPSRSPAPSPIGMPVETRSPPVAKGAKFQSLNKPAVPVPAVQVSSLQTYFRLF